MNECLLSTPLQLYTAVKKWQKWATYTQYQKCMEHNISEKIIATVSLVATWNRYMQRNSERMNYTVHH